MIRKTAGNRERKISPENEKRQTGSVEMRGKWQTRLRQREDEKGEKSKKNLWRKNLKDETHDWITGRGQQRRRKTSS